MFYLIVLVLVAVIVLLAVAAGRRPLGLAGLAVHPFNLLGFFIAVTVADFLAAYGTVRSGGSIYLATYSEYSARAVTNGILFFAFCAVAIAVGVWAACIGPTATATATATDSADRADRRAAKIVFILAASVALCTVVTVVGVALSRGSLLYVAGIRGTYFRDNPLLFVLYSMLLPAFFLFGSRAKTLTPILLALALSTALLLPLGSRGSLAILAVGAVFWICRRVKLPVITLYLAAPVVGIFLLVYRWAARDSYYFSSFSQFIQARGGIGNALFGTPDISMAESMTINLASKTVERSPWESLVGMFTIPVPRSLIPWKPIGASTEFTQRSDLGRWVLVKSEWTVTGFVNLLMDFGYVGAILLTGVIAFVWARSLTRAERQPLKIAFAGPMLIYFAYIFYRADLYNLGIALWPAAIVVAGHQIVRWMLQQSDAPRARASHQRARSPSGSGVFRRNLL